MSIPGGSICEEMLVWNRIERSGVKTFENLLRSIFVKGKPTDPHISTLPECSQWRGINETRFFENLAESIDLTIYNGNHCTADDNVRLRARRSMNTNTDCYKDSYRKTAKR